MTPQPTPTRQHYVDRHEDTLAVHEERVIDGEIAPHSLDDHVVWFSDEAWREIIPLVQAALPPEPVPPPVSATTSPPESPSEPVNTEESGDNLDDTEGESSELRGALRAARR